VVLDRLENDRSNLVRFWAAQSFATSPDPRAIETLVRVYEHSEEAEVRYGCIEALATIGGDAAEATVRKALDDKDTLVRDAAARCLQYMLSHK
jgi:HEAT repeat protein